jgi:IS5 family transposase
VALWHESPCGGGSQEQNHPHGSGYGGERRRLDGASRSAARVWGDQAYKGQSHVVKECAPRAQDHTHRRYRYKNGIDEQERAKNRSKSSARSKVEHVFQVMKLKFGFMKLRYRGLKKNAHRLFVTCALVNLFLSRRKLLLTANA